MPALSNNPGAMPHVVPRQPAHGNGGSTLKLDVIGAVSGVLALFISSMQAWHDMAKSPLTTTTNAGSTLDLTFDPVEHALTFKFPVLLQNDGSIDDVLQGAKASLNVESQLSGEDSNLTMTADGQVSVSLPFPVRVGSQGLNIALKSANSSLVKANSQNKIELLLRAKSQPLTPIGYCFELTQAQIAEMLNSQKLWHKQFVAAACDSTPP